MKKRISALLLVICMVVAGILCPTSAQAKSKKAFYYCSLHSEMNGDDTTGQITKITKNGNKMKLKGEFYKSGSYTEYCDGGYDTLKNKTFKLSKKCKYYYTTGRGTKKVSKSRFFKELKKEWGPGNTLTFETNKSGYVRTITYDVSM